MGSWKQQCVTFNKKGQRGHLQRPQAAPWSLTSTCLCLGSTLAPTTASRELRASLLCSVPPQCPAESKFAEGLVPPGGGGL